MDWQLTESHRLGSFQQPTYRIARKTLFQTGNLPNLQTLWLSNNQLRELPESLGKLPNLKRLVIVTTNIQHYPSLGNLQNLTELWLNNNQLTALPAWIGKLPELDVLHIEGNPLDELQEIIFLTQNTEFDIFQEGNPLDDTTKDNVLAQMGPKGIMIS